jgi:cation diffusion facilitator family transporter
VIAGLTIVGVTGVRLFDPLVALGLAAYMGWTAVTLARAALAEIMDVALPDEELRAIHDIIATHEDEIRGFHRLRSRKAGPTRHIDMHLIVDPHSTMEDVHAVCDKIEREIAERLPGAVVTIHPEPDDGRYRGPLNRTPEDRP